MELPKAVQLLSRMDRDRRAQASFDKAGSTPDVAGKSSKAKQQSRKKSPGSFQSELSEFRNLEACVFSSNTCGGSRTAKGGNAAGKGTGRSTVKGKEKRPSKGSGKGSGKIKKAGFQGVPVALCSSPP